MASNSGAATEKMGEELRKMFKGISKGIGNVTDWEERMVSGSFNKLGRPSIEALLRQAGLLTPPPAAGSGGVGAAVGDPGLKPFALLDNGCGAGGVCSMLQAAVPRDVLARSTIINADFSEQMVGISQRRAEKEGWINAEARVLDAENTGLPSNSFTHVTASFCFHVVPNSLTAVADSIRVLKPGGVLALTTWHEFNAGWSPDVRSAFASLPFDVPALPFPAPMQMSRDGHWGDVNWVRRMLEEFDSSAGGAAAQQESASSAGCALEDVRVDVVSAIERVDSAAEFVDRYGMVLALTVNSTWPEDTRAAHPLDEVKHLVCEHLEQKHSGRPWDLTWTAVVATARKKSQ